MTKILQQAHLGSVVLFLHGKGTNALLDKESHAPINISVFLYREAFCATQSLFIFCCITCHPYRQNMVKKKNLKAVVFGDRKQQRGGWNKRTENLTQAIKKLHFSLFCPSVTKRNLGKCFLLYGSHQCLISSVSASTSRDTGMKMKRKGKWKNKEQTKEKSSKN